MGALSAVGAALDAWVAGEIEIGGSWTGVETVFALRSGTVVEAEFGLGFWTGFEAALGLGF